MKTYEEENDICQKCFCEITDRRKKKFSILKICTGCRRKNRKEQLQRWWRKSHPEPNYKHQKIIELLQQKPSTTQELMGTANIKNKTTLRSTIHNLREKGYHIQSTSCLVSHYVLVMEPDVEKLP